MAISEVNRHSPLWFLTGNIRVLVFGRALWSFSTSIVYPFLSLYILALGGTPTEIGLINSLGLIAGMILYPVGGYVGDRMGRVRLVGFATYAYAISNLLFVFAINWQALAVAQFLHQLLLFYMPAMNALESDSLPPGVRGRGFATIMAIPNSIRIIAPYVGGWIIAVYGGGDAGMIRAIRICWGFSFLTGLLVATTRLKYLSETLIKEEAGGRPSLRGLPEIVKEAYASIFESMKWMNRPLWGIVIVEAVSSLFVAMSAPLWIVYATQVMGITAYDWGIMLLISGLVSVTLAYPLGSLVDKFGPRRMILLALGLAPPITFLYIHSKDFLAVTTILCLIGVVNGILMPAFSTIIADMIPRKRRARLYSLLGERGVTYSFGNFWGGGFLLFPAAALGAFVGGHVYEMNPTYPWIILSIATFASLVLAVRYIKEPEDVQT